MSIQHCTFRLSFLSHSLLPFRIPPQPTTTKIISNAPDLQPKAPTVEEAEVGIIDMCREYPSISDGLTYRQADSVMVILTFTVCVFIRQLMRWRRTVKGVRGRMGVKRRKRRVKVTMRTMFRLQLEKSKLHRWPTLGPPAIPGCPSRQEVSRYHDFISQYPWRVGYQSLQSLEGWLILWYSETAVDLVLIFDFCSFHKVRGP